MVGRAADASVLFRRQVIDAISRHVSFIIVSDSQQPMAADYVAFWH